MSKPEPLVNDLFQRLRTGGFEALKMLVEERFQEGTTLEMKLKKNAAHGVFEREDKKNLGKTLSAFSNSMGGLLIWGVECRKDPDQGDCASSLKPICGLDIFSSAASDLIGQYLQPKNEDVETATVSCPDDPTKGFLLIRVGRSERRPHRSDSPDDGHYYKRVGASSFAMEHYDIEDAFRRRSVAELELVHRVQFESGIGTIKILSILLSLKNVSQTSALYPFLEIGKVEVGRLSSYGLDGNYGFGLNRRILAGKVFFGGGSDSSIHPGYSLDVTPVRVAVSGIESDLGTSQFDGLRVCDQRSFPVKIEYNLGCADALTKSGVYEVPFGDIEDVLSVR